MSPPPISPCGTPKGSTRVSAWSRSKETGLTVGAGCATRRLAPGRAPWPWPRWRWPMNWSGRPARCSNWPGRMPWGAIQFGRPISDFQAVRHRLADTLVAIEAAHAMLEAAWRDQSADTAAMAKALAGRGARYRRSTLPAGAGRHRVHHRARLPPLRAARLRARPTLRHGPIPDQGPRGPPAGVPPADGSHPCLPSDVLDPGVGAWS